MPFLLDSSERTDLVAEAVNRLMAERGQAGLTMRAIAQETGLSTSSLVHQFTNRSRLLTVTCYRSGRAHVGHLADRVRASGVDGLVPAGDDLALDRAWLSWCDLGRFDQGVGDSVADIELDERAVIARVLPKGNPASDDLLAATVRGLRAEVCRGVDPMPFEHARALLRALLEQLGRQAA